MGKAFTPRSRWHFSTANLPGNSMHLKDTLQKSWSCSKVKFPKILWWFCSGVCCASLLFSVNMQVLFCCRFGNKWIDLKLGNVWIANFTGSNSTALICRWCSCFDHKPPVCTPWHAAPLTLGWCICLYQDLALWLQHAPGIGECQILANKSVPILNGGSESPCTDKISDFWGSEFVDVVNFGTVIWLEERPI